MDYRKELLSLLKYCSESANFITDDDSTEDKYAKSAYMDVISKIEEIFEREQESSDESAALPLHGVNQRSELFALLEWMQKEPAFGIDDIDEVLDDYCFYKANCG